MHETDARHATHLAALALPYASEFYPELDQAKIALYSLLHDIVEAYAGDVPSLNMSDAVMEAKERAEATAMRQVSSEFGACYPQFVRLIQDYEDLADDEARFVKTFDKLDPHFTHLNNNGITLRRDFHIQSARHLINVMNATAARMRSYAGDFPEVMADREELICRVADSTPWDQ
jgi:5'-deoxynucleotidase YfbR-like HD superfamily hydrolase